MSDGTGLIYLNKVFGWRTPQHLATLDIHVQPVAAVHGGVR